MISTLIGALLNIILDPLFIFAFRWGMMGAAVATVIGQIATALLAVGYLCRARIIRPAKRDFLLHSGIIGKTLSWTVQLSRANLPGGSNGGDQ